MTIYKSKLLTFAKLVKIRRHSVEPVPNNTLDKNYSENINYVEKYKTSLSICKALGTFLGNLNKKVFILTNTYSRPKFTCPSPFCDFFFYNCTIDNDEMKKSKIFFYSHMFPPGEIITIKIIFLTEIYIWKLLTVFIIWKSLGTPRKYFNVIIWVLSSQLQGWILVDAFIFSCVLTSDNLEVF